MNKNKFDIGDIVYFPADMSLMLRDVYEGKLKTGVKAHPLVQWGVIDYIEHEKYHVVSQCLRHIEIIDDVPFADFVQTKPYKVTKDFNETEFIKEHVKHEPISEDLIKVNIQDRDSLEKLLFSGYLEPVNEVQAETLSVEFTTDKKHVYIKKTKTPWFFGSNNHTHSLYKVYSDYDEAMTQAKAVCLKWELLQSKVLEMDFLDDIASLEKRLPDKDKHIIDMLRLLPHNWGYSLRLYKNEILYRSSANSPYVSLYVCKSKI